MNQNYPLLSQTGFSFGKGFFKTFAAGIEREWVITNGLGSYAGSSIIGAHTRKHHGLLIASLHAPTERFQFLSKIKEAISIENETFSLDATQYTNQTYHNGQHYLQRFLFEGVPTFVYEVNGCLVEKTFSFHYGHNTIAIFYTLYNGPKNATYTFTPLFNDRDHNDGSTKADLEALAFRCRESERAYHLTSAKHPDLTLHFAYSDGTLCKADPLYEEGIELQTEIDTGNSGEDCSYSPILLKLELKPYERKTVSLICSLEDSYPLDAFQVIQDELLRKEALLQKAGHTDVFANRLVLAADQFIANRESTGYKTILAGLPWFTDWGRDTMIALQGLTLCTNRLEDTKDILLTFANYVSDGLVPNMFPDEGLAPLYNTADASLWYFYSVDQYLRATGNEDAYHFIQTMIYPRLKEIIKAYHDGCAFSIYMDHDYLIHAGGDFDQVTWMDVRSGDWVVTPRHGKPVEINALWYNALKVMEDLSYRFDDHDFSYGELAEKVKESFIKRFYNPDTHCLYDVVEEEQDSAKFSQYNKPAPKVDVIHKKENGQIRPNQLYAVSLPYSMLTDEIAKNVVDVCLEKLYASVGMRSLSADDPEYIGLYKGALHVRDGAYHQGTVWAFPLGAMISAYLRVYGNRDGAREFAQKLLAPVNDHLSDGCIGQIAEIFDGDEPHISRGCYGQAWSVGEILRAYLECLS